MSKLVILFDDERTFAPGFRDEAVVLRTVDEAVEFFKNLRNSEEIVDELWLDFVLNPGTTPDALPELPADRVKKVFYHSSASGGKGLVEAYLSDGGYTGTVDVPSENNFVEH